jgi:eukaryotic-like serine/threonine-protein kinase
VAIKLLDAHSGDAAAGESFRARVCRAASLVHEGIVRIFDYDEPDSLEHGVGPYLVRELVDGQSILDLIAAGPIAAARSMDIVRQVAAALDVVHRAGIAHGDITARNILVAPEGVVKLVDLVAARAPESASAACDLYAVGVAAHQCLTGKALAVEVAPATGDRHQPLPPLPWNVPEPVTKLVRDLTAPDSAGQHATAAAVAARARAVRDELGWTGSMARPAATMTLALTGTGIAPKQGQECRVVPAPRRPMPADFWVRGIADTDAPSYGPAGRPLRPQRPVATRVSAVIVLALLALTGYALLKPSRGAPQVDQVAHVTTVTIKATDLYGTPVSVARLRLERQGLVVRVVWRPTTRVGPGRVSAVSPTGRVRAGSLITLTGALAPPQAHGALSLRHAPKPTSRHHARHSDAGASPSPSAAPTPPGTPSPSPAPTGTPPGTSPPPTSSPPASGPPPSSPQATQVTK